MKCRTRHRNDARWVQQRHDERLAAERVGAAGQRNAALTKQREALSEEERRA